MNSNKLSRVAVDYLDRFYEIHENMKNDLTRVDGDLTACCQFICQSMIMNAAVGENAKNILRFTTYLPVESFALTAEDESRAYNKAISEVEGFCEVDKARQKRLYLQSVNGLLARYSDSVCKIVEDNDINLDYIRRSIALDRAIARLCRSALRFTDCEPVRPAINLLMSQSFGRIGRLESIFRRIK